MERDGQEILLTLQGMTVESIDSTSGRARVKASGKDCGVLRVQHVFTAIGAEPDACWSLAHANGEGILRLSHCAMVFRGLPAVYGGDLVNRFQSVADAIASGKEAAMAIDTYFTEGKDPIENKLQACRVGNGPALSMTAYVAQEGNPKNTHTVSHGEINTDYFVHSPRTELQSIAPQERVQSFSKILGDFSAEDACREAKRCFNCGTCTACDNCVLFCPEAAVLVDPYRKIDMDYCKGCGVCVVECPRNAMTLKEERHENGA
jgi:Pyruvate/2-oxoacid:ferredoxin oxidoreductase delta subunit